MALFATEMQSGTGAVPYWHFFINDEDHHCRNPPPIPDEWERLSQQDWEAIWSDIDNVEKRRGRHCCGGTLFCLVALVGAVVVANMYASHVILIATLVCVPIFGLVSCIVGCDHNTACMIRSMRRVCQKHNTGCLSPTFALEMDLYIKLIPNIWGKTRKIPIPCLFGYTRDVTNTSDHRQMSDSDTNGSLWEFRREHALLPLDRPVGLTSTLVPPPGFDRDIQSIWTEFWPSFYAATKEILARRRRARWKAFWWSIALVVCFVTVTASLIIFWSNTDWIESFLIAVMVEIIVIAIKCCCLDDENIDCSVLYRDQVLDNFARPFARQGIYLEIIPSVLVHRRICLPAFRWTKLEYLRLIPVSLTAVA